MRGIGSRIRQFREQTGHKVKGFAELIGISQGSLSDIENEKTMPSAKTLASLVRITDIEPVWLLTGEERQTVNAEGIIPFQSPEEREYLEKLLEVLRNPNTKRAIQENIDTFLKVPRPEVDPLSVKKKGVVNHS